MKNFDIIIGNPPYNSPRGSTRSTKIRQIYPKFVEKSSKLSNNIWFVLPSRWMGLQLSKKIRDLFYNCGLKYIKIIDSKQKYFNDAIIEGGICYVNFINGHSDKILCELENGALIEKKFSDKIILHNDLDIFESIIKKINIKTSKFMNSIWVQNQQIKSNDKRINNKNGFDIMTSKGMKKLDEKESYIHNVKLNYNKYKSCFSYTTTNYKNGYGKMFIINNKVLVNMSYAYFPHDTKHQAENCLNYLNTKFVMAIKNVTHVNINFTSEVFINIPIMDFNINWNDDDLYSFYNLSKNEVSFIETYG